MYILLNESDPLVSSSIKSEAYKVLSVHSEETKKEEAIDFILTMIVTELSEDVDFLRKVNKITFGLISKQQ